MTPSQSHTHVLHSSWTWWRSRLYTRSSRLELGLLAEVGSLTFVRRDRPHFAAHKRPTQRTNDPRSVCKWRNHARSAAKLMPSAAETGRPSSAAARSRVSCWRSARRSGSWRSSCSTRPTCSRYPARWSSSRRRPTRRRARGSASQGHGRRAGRWRHNTPFKRTRDGDDGSGGSRRRGSEDKERRLSRVGLSYVRHLRQAEEGARVHRRARRQDQRRRHRGDAGAGVGGGREPGGARERAGAGRSRSKAKAEASGGSGGGSGAKEKGSGGRSASGGGGRKRGGARGAQEEKGKLLDEIDLAMHRPPSVITPEDGNLNGNLNGLAGPSSMPSASDMFSPGTLMQHLLGTPTPQQGVPVPPAAPRCRRRARRAAPAPSPPSPRRAARRSRPGRCTPSGQD